MEPVRRRPCSFSAACSALKLSRHSRTRSLTFVGFLALHLHPLKDRHVGLEPALGQFTSRQRRLPSRKRGAFGTAL